jgi:PAS domain S-box-containing protein
VTGDQHLAEAVGLARAWTRALEGVAAPGVGEKLSDLTGRLALEACSALHHRREARTVGRQIGRTLAEAGLAAPGVVENVVRALGEYWLADDPEGPSAADPASVAALQGGIAGGHSEAVRRLLLAQQEAIHRAAFRARDEAQLAAHTAHAQFEAVFAASGVGIGIADLGGRILDVNQALEAMLGYSLEELQGRATNEFVHPDQSQLAAADQEALAAGKVDVIHTRRRFRHRDGRLVSARVSLRLVRDGDGHPLHALAVFTDLPAPASCAGPRAPASPGSEFG